jgi:hypothetical protein
LEADGEALSPAMIAIILKQAGFAKLPRWADADPRPEVSGGGAGVYA